MMQRLLQFLEQRDPRLPVIVAGLLVLLLVVEGWLLVLRKPLAEYWRVSAQANTLESAVQANQAPSSAATQMEQELARLSTQLSGELQIVQGGDRVVATLLEKLDQSARTAGLRLSAVRPDQRRTVAGFDERSFSVVVSGRYLALANWMLGFGEQLGHNVSIADLELRPTPGEDGRLSLSLRIALYLPATAGKPAT